MFKLIIIIVGLIFAFFCYRKTWYSSWAFLFNILISIYISIMTAPQIIDKIPYIREHIGNFAYSAGILAEAVIVFTVIQFLSYKLLTSVYCISFPKIFNTVGAAVLGFVAGMVLAGFSLFLTTIAPLDDYPAVESLVQTSQAPDKAGGVVRDSCIFIHNVSSHAHPVGVDRQMGKIASGWKGPETEQESEPSNLNMDNTKVAEVNFPEL